MADVQKWVESILAGLLTGGGAAATTVLASFKDIKGRLKALEDKLGSDEDPRTGLYLAIYQLREQGRSTRAMLDDWAEDPPEWMRRLVRNRPSSVSGLGEFLAVEERLNEGLAQVRNRLAKVESAVQGGSDDLVTREEYQRECRERAEELRKIQRQLAETTGLLRGVMAGLGYIDGPGAKEPRK